jgi:hypothetical protein
MLKGAHMKSENRLAAEAIMKTPAYWRDRDPDLNRQVYRMTQAVVGTGSVQTGRKTLGAKGNLL